MILLDHADPARFDRSVGKMWARLHFMGSHKVQPSCEMGAGLAHLQ